MQKGEERKTQERQNNLGESCCNLDDKHMEKAVTALRIAGIWVDVRKINKVMTPHQFCKCTATLRQTNKKRQQNAGFRRLRASFLHTAIINLRAEIKDPRAKEIIDSARKRFPGAAHGQPPPTAGSFQLLEGCN
ncbi:uncharacterized protein LOC143694366 isoform X2 [Agelaius phoeniceus]|uniref:uncharacterized protein LOC143694366 isoform X2 n=1 Tax=Agelaius phoeniceus TaxID=39638 RepID=UPI004054D5BC